MTFSWQVLFVYTVTGKLIEALSYLKSQSLEQGTK